MNSPKPSKFLVVLKREAEAHLRSMRLDEALAAIEKMEAEDPLSVTTRGLRLDYLHRAKRHDEASTLAHQLTELFPQSPRVHQLASQVAYSTRDYKLAEAWARECDRLHPHPSTTRLLGKTLTQLGRFDEAEALLLSVVDNNVSVQRDLAWLYERKGEIGRALQAIEAFLKAHPADSFARNQCVRLRALESGPDELIAEAEELESLGESVEPALVPEYVKSLLLKGRVPEARRLATEQRESADPTIRRQLAWVLYKQLQHDLALELFCDLLPLDAGNPKMLTAMESAARKSGQLERLADAFEALAPRDRRFYGRAARLRKM